MEVSRKSITTQSAQGILGGLAAFGPTPLIQAIAAGGLALVSAVHVWVQGKIDLENARGAGTVAVIKEAGEDDARPAGGGK